MSRRNVSAEIRRWKCPVCNYRRPTARRLAQHIAMKWDDTHRTWRKERAILPIEYKTLGEARQIASQILPFLRCSSSLDKKA